MLQRSEPWALQEFRAALKARPLTLRPLGHGSCSFWMLSRFAAFPSRFRISDDPEEARGVKRKSPIVASSDVRSLYKPQWQARTSTNLECRAPQNCTRNVYDCTTGGLAALVCSGPWSMQVDSCCRRRGRTQAKLEMHRPLGQLG